MIMCCFRLDAEGVSTVHVQQLVQERDEIAKRDFSVYLFIVQLYAV